MKKVDMTSSEADCGYSRLSVDRDGTKLGYEVQQDDGNAWAEHRGHVIAHWYKDANLTAADENVWREDYEQMLRDIGAGMWKGIIVWRIDRLTRIPYEFERCLRAVRKNGGYIISVKEHLDSRNQNDLFVMRYKVLNGDMEVQAIKDRTKSNKSKKTHAGNYTGGGRRPYGFEAATYDDLGKVTNHGRIGVIQIPDEVANLKEAARRIAWEGESYSDVINDWLDRETPILGAYAAPWNTKTLQHILTAPRMIGMQEWTNPGDESGKRELVKAVWEPVLDERTWNRLKSLVRRADKTYNARETYLLSNILLCGRCHMPLTGSQRTYLKDGEQRATRGYRCPSGKPYKVRGNCGKLNVIAGPVEDIVISFVLARVKRTRGFNASFNGADESTHELLDLLETKKRETLEQEAELADAYARKLIKMSEWLAARGPIQDQLEGYELKMKSLSTRLAIATPVGTDFDDLNAWFEKLSLRQQKILINANIARVEVAPPGRSGRYFRRDRVSVTLADLEVPNVESE